MKILSMHIYGFGQIENMKIENIDDFQVFYGENEAGKSTIMAFIHGILFGFPTKQQAELRYEPKMGSKYGGNIKIYSKEYGIVLIERVKGKTAAGEVSVTLENGTAGGEDLLKELLNGFDKGLYQAIFSFNLHGLQNIHQMKGEDLGKFLFSAGTLGTDRLSTASNELEKELDLRFKPGGKKPLINQKLQVIHHLNSELKAAAAKNQEYGQYVHKRDEIQREMGCIRETLQDLHEKLDKLNEWKKVRPFVEEKRLVEAELNGMGEISFPARGIERFEKLTPLLHTYEARISSLKERIAKMKAKLGEIQPDSTILDKTAEILTAVDQYPLYEQARRQSEEAERKLAAVEEKISEISEKLHLSLSEDELAAMNTNIYMKNQVEEIFREGQTLKSVQQELEIRFNEEKDALERIEADVRLARTKIIPDHEKAQLEQRANEELNRDRLEAKLQTVRDQIEFFQRADKQQKSQAQTSRKQKQMQYGLFALLFVAIGVYGWHSGQMPLLVIAGLGLIAAVILYFRNLTQPKQLHVNQTIHDLREEEKRLSAKLHSDELLKASALREKLALDDRRREQLQVLLGQLETQQSHYEKVIEKFEQLESGLAQHKEKLKKICSHLKIPEYIAKDLLLDAFQLIEQAKAAIREKRQLQTSLAKWKETQAEFTTKLKLLFDGLPQASKSDLKKSVLFLENKLKEEQERNIQWQEQQEKLAELEADLLQANREHLHIEGGMNQLLQEAGVKTEEDFYELGGRAEKQKQLKNRLDDLNKQLDLSLLTHQEIEAFLPIRDSDARIRELQHEQASLNSRLNQIQEDAASLKYEIQRLEEGGLYSELLHQYKQEQFELAEAAKDWAVYAIAQDILARTVETYKNVHLPRMLVAAEEFLSFLTDGHYHKILLHPSGPGFLIVREDEMVFEANELSQATTEQVYVAIRLALATTIYENDRFPIIIDDSFVNFDSKRTAKVIELLKGLKHNQIIFFTCHEHLLKYFQKEQLVCINNGAVQLK